VTSRFAAQSELDAAFAAGVGFGRLIAPLVAFATVLALASVVLLGWLQPHSRYAYRSVVYLVSNAAWGATLEPGAFVGDGTITLMAERIDAGRRELGAVFIDRREGAGGTTTTARTGHLVRDAGGAGVILRLADGVEIRSGPRADDVAVLRFDRLDVPLDVGQAVAPFRLRGEGERELTMGELWARRDETSVEGPRIRAARLVRACSLIVLPFVAAPFGLAAKRARQGAGLVAAAAVLLIYHHLLQFGESLVDLGRVPALPALWLPFAAFAVFGLWLSARVARRPGANPLDVVLDALERSGRRMAVWRRWSKPTIEAT
jgi:lipopolysaccharide export system permease protein